MVQTRYWLSSAAFHGLLFFVFIFLQKHEFNRAVVDSLNRTPQSIEVRSLSEKEFTQLTKQIVRAEKIPEPLLSKKTSETEAVFLSKTTQSVEKNQRAALTGSHKNSYEQKKSASSTAKSRATPQPQPTLRSLFTLTEEASDSSQNAGRSPASFGEETEDSATDDYLPNVAVGTQTLLNTKEYKFYPFFERIRDRVSQYWTRQLDSEELRMKLFEGRDISELTLTTKLIISLDTSGALVSMRIVESAGYPELDQAARYAFTSAAPFPNPPSQLFETEGNETFVNLEWRFVVTIKNDDSLRFQMSGRRIND